MVSFISFIIVLITLLLSSITDIKKKEVPNVLPQLCLSVGLFLSFFSPHLTQHIVIMLGCAVFGYVLFYNGVWGGADTRLLMAIGIFSTTQTIIMYGIWLLISMWIAFAVARVRCKRNVAFVPYMTFAWIMTYASLTF